MKNTNTARTRRRIGSKTIRKGIPIFAATVLGVVGLVIVLKLIALAAPISQTEESQKTYGFDLTEVNQIYAQHQKDVEARRNEMQEAMMQNATGETSREESSSEISETSSYEQSEETSQISEETSNDEKTQKQENGPMLSAEGPGESYFYQVTQDEKIMIAKVVWAEARGESLEGQVAVAATIFNRLYSDDPAIENDSIYAVVHQSGAYASIANVSYEQGLTCIEAVDQACRGYDPTRKIFANGARFFYAQSWIDDDELAKREGVTKLIIGNHTFHDSFSSES